MYCMNCGFKLSDDSKFCSNCGSAVNAYEKHISTIKVEDIQNENNTIEKTPDIPESLLKCDILKIQGKQYEFTDENNTVIITMNKTPESKLLEPIIEYKGANKSSTFERFMTTKKTASYNFTAYDNNNEIIGSAVYINNLKNIIKTVIEIKNKDGEEYKFEEDLTVLKGIGKIISPQSLGLGKFMDERTGNMDIKKGDEVIGRIDSTRGALNNTYIVRDCASLRDKMDIRLIVLGMVTKCFCVK